MDTLLTEVEHVHSVGSDEHSFGSFDLSEPRGVLMSTVNGDSAIGRVTGNAMAASEVSDPFPSVEVPEGPTYYQKREKRAYG